MTYKVDGGMGYITVVTRNIQHDPLSEGRVALKVTFIYPASLFSGIYHQIRTCGACVLIIYISQHFRSAAHSIPVPHHGFLQQVRPLLC